MQLSIDIIINLAVLHCSKIINVVGYERIFKILIYIFKNGMHPQI